MDEKIKRINEIELNEEDWGDRIYLTFDVDWAHDKVISYTLDIIEQYDVEATFFVTHKTRLLDRMKENKKVELGIHPNFTELLSSNNIYGSNIDEVVQYYLRIVPEAVSVRSHRLTHDSNILSSFSKYGLKYDCNHFVPADAGISLKPWLFWDGKLIIVPYFWEDDIHIVYSWDWNAGEFVKARGLKVFNFHPTHVFLNTEKLERYESTRPHSRNVLELKKYINKTNYGTKNFLIDLLDLLKNK